MNLLLLLTEIVARGAAFTCTPVAVWDGDGPIWCAEGPRIRLSGIAAREIDGSCSSGHPCPTSSGTAARDHLVGLLGGSRGRLRVATSLSAALCFAACRWAPAEERGRPRSAQRLASAICHVRWYAAVTRCAGGFMAAIGSAEPSATASSELILRDRRGGAWPSDARAAMSLVRSVRGSLFGVRRLVAKYVCAAQS